MPDPVQYLIDAPGLWSKDEHQRKQMTVSCRDTDYIPKVEHAGLIEDTTKGKVQIMHNGLRVSLGGYHGEWMSEIIKDLKGHHEPQEEKLFYEVLKRVEAGSAIIELGSFWSYYSLWFLSAIKGSKAFCSEPDPKNRAVGELNAELNGMDATFLSAAAGSQNGVKISLPLDSNPAEEVTVEVRSVDSIVSENSIKKVGILHMDVQGVELDALKGSIKSIKQQKIRFVFVSTHHYYFSRNPNTHSECLTFLRENGAHIVSSHTIAESFSGDGLIVASFSNEDKDLRIETSLCHSDDSLFRSPEEDVALLASLVNKHKKEG